MRFGLFASILLHLAVAGLAFLSLPESWRTRIVNEPVVPIELISAAELAKLTSVPAARPEPEPEPQPETAPAPEPDPAPPVAEEARPEPARAPPQKVAAAEPEPVKPEPEPEPEPKPESKPEPPKPQPRPEPPKPKPREEELDLDRLAALVDKARDRQPAAAQAPAETAQQADRPQPRIGAGDRLTASDRAKMKAAVARCWNVTALAGAPEANKLVVTVEFELNRDGTLAGQPRVANATQIALSGNRFWKAAEQTALRAIISCQPYDFLPQERYDDWKAWAINFDPSEMAGY